MPVSCESIEPGLSIWHANHSEDLRELVLAHLRNHPLSPLENEVFLVQSNGMAQWLRLRFAEDDGHGIAAAMDMQMPARFLWNVYRAVLGQDAVPEHSPFEKERLIWRLLRLLPECLNDERFIALGHYLADGTDFSKRYQLAERLADLFDQYQVYRADWLADWAAGRDVLRDAHGQPQPLAEKMQWQAELWRRLLEDVPSGEQASSRAAVHQQFLQALQSGYLFHSELPRRVVVFGISSLPLQVLEALEALSKFSQIVICVMNPCQYYWADIIEERQLLRFQHHRHAARQGLANLSAHSLHAAVNPLLAAWGKQGRDYIGLLYSYDQARESNEQIDVFQAYLDSNNPKLLQMIQQDILELKPVAETPEQRQVVAQEDESVRITVAHSRQREVEILHDHLLDLFNREKSTLQPRNIIVMVPDITAYAPHIEAVFGRLGRDDHRYIPYTIADRPERSQSQILIALDLLLTLPESRFTTGNLMDLLDVAAFRERFGLQMENLPTLQNWIQASGIRWGLHASHRAGLELPEQLEQNSWQFGLRRMLLGYASGRVAWLEIEPFAEAGGLEAASAGRLARVLEVLDAYWRELSKPRSASAWADILRHLVDDCLMPTSSEDVLVLDRFREVVGQWQEACAQGRLTEDLPLTVVREALLTKFESSGVSQRFLAGMVNFCTMMPMRAIPFQVVCLLGMNDADYPRQRPPLDFDLMAENYRPGDRTRREDDRYLFLEALLSAREQLYISYIGRSERDNSERTPSVLVGQLCEHIDAGWRLDGTPPTSQVLVKHLTVVHPLQPFSNTYFTPDRDPRLFTFAREWREVHEDSRGAVEDCLPPWQPEEPLQFEGLVRFLREPAELFFRERLKVYLRDEDLASEDHEPFELNRLQQYLLKKELIEQALQAPVESREEVLVAAVQRMARRGEFPLGAQGKLVAKELLDPALGVVSHWAQVQSIWSRPIEPKEVRLDLLKSSNLVRFEDWLGQVHQDECGNLARIEWYPNQVFADKGGFKHHYFLSLWAHHLIGNTAGMELSSVLVTADGIRRIKPLEQEVAREHLEALVAAWQEGLCSCLPLAKKTAFAWLNECHKGDDQAFKNARKSYEDGYDFKGECSKSLALKRSWPTFESLCENGFPELTKKVYGPLHDALQNIEVIHEPPRGVGQ